MFTSLPALSVIIYIINFVIIMHFVLMHCNKKIVTKIRVKCNNVHAASVMGMAIFLHVR